jgi:hypothetical protein
MRRSRKTPIETAKEKSKGIKSTYFNAVRKKESTKLESSWKKYRKKIHREPISLQKKG